MPVFRERVDRPGKSEESGTRDRSIHRTKQREASVERRPIISQERPILKRQVKDTPREADKRRVRVPEVKKTSSRTVSIKSSEPSEVEKSSGSSSKSTNNSKPSKSGQSVKNTVQISKYSSRSISKPTKVVAKAPEKEHTPKTIKQPRDKLSKREEVVNPRHRRSRTRTLSPSEVKILPKTVVVQSEIVKPETKVLSDKEELQENNIDKDENLNISTTDDVDKEVEDDDDDEEEEEEDDHDDEYEDDFEDYESDFEEDETESEDMKGPVIKEDGDGNVLGSATRKRMVLTSAEERERKLDSGSYHISSIPSNWHMEDIKTAIQNENVQTSNLKESKAPSLELKEEMNLFTDSIIPTFDFTVANKRSMAHDKISKIKQRGEELMKMITLDTITYSILDIPAVPYDVFMTTYGKSNRAQVHVQTNEDNCDEEMQTEEISSMEKWTQMPPAFRATTNDSGKHAFIFTKEDKLGAGGDGISAEESDTELQKVSISSLNKFIANAAQKALAWLELGNQASISSQSKSSIEICDEMITLSSKSEKSTEKTSPIKFVTACSQHVIISVEKVYENESIIKVWTLLTPSAPMQTLICHHVVNCICVGPGRGDLVFAGAADGSVNVWDLRESFTLHNFEEKKEKYRSPTYSTAEILKYESHMVPIVNILVLDAETDFQDVDFSPIQICTLDEDGSVIIWSVIQQSADKGIEPNSDLGLAPWGRVHLIRNLQFWASNIVRDPKEDIFYKHNFQTMASLSSGRVLLIGSNTGQIAHCSTNGSPLKPKCFQPRGSSRPSSVTAIVVSESFHRYFLAGCNDGTIRLHCLDQETPLICLHWNMAEPAVTSSIKSLNWFPNRPCKFQAFDAASRVHIWNLAVSDIYPELSIPASKSNPFTCTSVLQPKKTSQMGSLVFGKANGTIEVHSIKTEWTKKKAKDEMRREHKLFQKYVKIL